jgi:hypothetical protein
MASQQFVRVYTGRHRQQDFMHDMQKLARDGYQVTTQSDIAERPGCLALLTFGIFARNRYKLTVTYTRQTA